jgi:hypothetical protein
VSVTQQIDFNGTPRKMLAAVLLGVAEGAREPPRASCRHRSCQGGIYKGRKTGATKATPKRAMQLRERGLSDNRDIISGVGH